MSEESQPNEFEIRLAHHLPTPYSHSVKSALPVRTDHALSRKEKRVVIRATERAAAMRLNALLSESAQSLTVHLAEHSNWKFTELTDYRRELIDQERVLEDHNNIVEFSNVVTQLSADALLGVYKQGVANIARPLSEPLEGEKPVGFLQGLVNWIDL
jgi:hypothetical protein